MDELQHLFHSLFLNTPCLTAGQCKLIAGMRKQYKHGQQLSARQIQVLREISKYLPDNAK